MTDLGDELREIGYMLEDVLMLLLDYVWIVRGGPQNEGFDCGPRSAGRPVKYREAVTREFARVVESLSYKDALTVVAYLGLIARPASGGPGDSQGSRMLPS
ncbi:MAG: hypothetical protein NUW23_11925 [Firmicutes bacterium]|jgi:hypothetical protein|nr:hypothetical protein [Bacillota bacterium]